MSLQNRIVEGCVVITIRLEAPLPPYSVDGEDPEAEADPFESVFRDFAILHTVTEASAQAKSNPTALFTPAGSRKSLLVGANRVSEIGFDSVQIPPALIHTLPNFCFPDGAKVLPSKPVSRHNSTHSFVISESGYYATCSTFYRETDARPFWLAYECVRPRRQPSTPRHVASPGSGGVSDGEFEIKSVFNRPGFETSPDSLDRCEKIYMPYCVCMVSRLPYLGVMSNILSSVIPRVEAADDIVDFLGPLMSDLARIPPPPNGPAAIQFRLREAFTGSKTSHITCNPPPLVDLPVIDFQLRYLLLTMSPSQLLTLMSALLTEQRIIFVSNNYAKLTPIIQTLISLLYPFRWQHVYIPVIPSHLRAFIEAPWPFLIGIHGRYIDEVLQECSKQAETPIVVNIDSGTVSVPDCITLLSIPEAPAASFIRKCSALELDFDLAKIGLAIHPELEVEERKRFVERLQLDIRSIFLSLMLDLFGDVRRHIMFDINPPVFNLDKFLTGKPPESEDFYRMAITASSFRAFQRSRHKHERDGFDLAAARRIRMPTTLSLFVYQLPDFISAASRRVSEPIEAIKGFFATSGNMGSHQHIELPNYQNFFERTVTQLTELIDRPNNSCICSLLHFRGVFRILKGDLIKGLNDFDKIMKMEAESFPADLVTDILVRRGTTELIEDVSKRGPTWRALLAKLEDGSRERSDSRLATPRRSRGSVRLPEIGGETEILNALKNGTSIDRTSFSAICDLLGITDSTAISITLYESLLALASKKDSGEGLPVELCLDFVTTWNGLLDRKEVLFPGLELKPDEEIIKVLPMVRRSDTGMATLVLTHKRVMLIPNNSTEAVPVCELIRILSIDKCQFKVLIPPGVPALRIYTQEPNDVEAQSGSRRSSWMKRRSTSNNDKVDEASQEQMLLFFNERDAWHGYIMEMAMAHKAISISKDSSLIMEAARNITLAEAVFLLTKENPSLEPELAADAVKRLMPLSNPTKLKRLVSETSHRCFVKKIDASPNQTQKSTVECILFIPDANADGSLWCGLGSGFIQVFEMPTGIVECRMKAHTDRVTCLLSVGEHVWSASFDSTVLIIDTRTRISIAMLEGIDGQVSSMFKDGDSVWATSLSGNLTQWNAVTHECITSINVNQLRGKYTSLRTCARINDTLWCGTGTVIVIIDLKTKKIKRERRSGLFENDLVPSSSSSILENVPEDPEDDAPANEVLDVSIPGSPTVGTPGQNLIRTPFVETLPDQNNSPSASGSPKEDTSFVLRTSASHCIIAGIQDEVWSCSNVSGLLHVWDANTFRPVKMGGEWRLDCRGFNTLLATASAIWGGGSNGSVYMWDPESHSLLQQLTSHSDGVRSLCAMEGQWVISGSGSNDGTLVVWKSSARMW